MSLSIYQRKGLHLGNAKIQKWREIVYNIVKNVKKDIISLMEDAMKLSIRVALKLGCFASFVRLDAIGVAGASVLEVKLGRKAGLKSKKKVKIILIISSIKSKGKDK